MMAACGGQGSAVRDLPADEPRGGPGEENENEDGTPDQVTAMGRASRGEVDGSLRASLSNPAGQVDPCLPRAIRQLLVEEYPDRLGLTRGEGYAGLLVGSGAEAARAAGELEVAGDIHGLPAGVVDLCLDNRLAAGGPGPGNRCHVEGH